MRPEHIRWGSHTCLLRSTMPRQPRPGPGPALGSSTAVAVGRRAGRASPGLARRRQAGRHATPSMLPLVLVVLVVKLVLLGREVVLSFRQGPARPLPRRRRPRDHDNA